METAALFRMMARFNGWANGRIYDSCAGLSDEELRRDRKAFFGSIHNTLNHLLVVDRAWTDRVEGKPASVKALNQILHDDFAGLRAAREAEDARLVRVVDALPQARVEGDLAYRFMDGTPAETPLEVVLITLFNHQTHHRGQVHQMLGEAGVSPPELDIVGFPYREALRA